MKKFNTSRRSFLGKTSAVVAGIALFSSTKTFAKLLDRTSPFEGYNPFIEEKTDLRTGSSLDKTLKISGQVYTSDGTQTISNARIEVWHLSPGSEKYKHRGYFFSNDEGQYTFHTDFPNRTEGKKPRIFFKSTSGSKIDFTELILDDNHAHISDTHWEKNKVLKRKLFPTYNKSLFETKIQFNFTI